MYINILLYTVLVCEKLIQYRYSFFSCLFLCFNLLLSVLHSQTLDSVNLSWYQSRKIRKPEIMSSSSSSSSLTNPSQSHSNQTQMFLLSNISNFVSVKLDHSNFLIWKFQITSILDAYSFMEYIDGSIPCPVKFLTDASGSETINPDFLQWKARDKVLISLISVTLSPSALSLVIGQTSARGIWEVLEKRYTSISRSNVVNLKMELNGVKKSSDSISKYLQRIKEARDKLSSVGVLIDDEEILHIILKGLPAEYHPFSASMRTKSDSVSFEELHALLSTEEELLKNIQELSKDTSLMAMTANKSTNSLPPNQVQPQYIGQNNRGRGKNQFNRGRGRGNSSRGGYNSGNFSTPTSQFSPNFGNTSRPTCQICYKQGHTALDCYQRMNFAY